MFCNDCGTELPDEANFCWKCGKPQREDIRVERPRWEICEITYPSPWVFLCWGHKFWADAIGPQGRYNAGDSPTFSTRRGGPYASSQEAVNAHNALIKKLFEDGWDP
jgi:hypothetical protein